jgi:hypothetical protein
MRDNPISITDGQLITKELHKKQEKVVKPDDIVNLYAHTHTHTHTDTHRHTRTHTHTDTHTHTHAHTHTHTHTHRDGLTDLSLLRRYDKIAENLRELSELDANRSHFTDKDLKVHHANTLLTLYQHFPDTMVNSVLTLYEHNTNNEHSNLRELFGVDANRFHFTDKDLKISSSLQIYTKT